METGNRRDCLDFRESTLSDSKAFVERLPRCAACSADLACASASRHSHSRDLHRDRIHGPPALCACGILRRRRGIQGPPRARRTEEATMFDAQHSPAFCSVRRGHRRTSKGTHRFNRSTLYPVMPIKGNDLEVVKERSKFLAPALQIRR